MRQAKQSEWISQLRTRAVFTTFGLFVPSTNYFFVATFLVECFSTVRDPAALLRRLSALRRAE